MRFCLLVSLFVMSAACGDDGNDPPGGGSGEVDAPPASTEDAPTTTVDAPTQPGEKGLGSTCTPSGSSPQGDCPAGYECLQLQGASAPWCSKTCSQQQDTCDQGYTGPGLAKCIWTITPAGGGQGRQFCGVICDAMGNNGICSAQQCNGTCPGELMCTANLQDQNMNVIAKACQ